MGDIKPNVRAEAAFNPDSEILPVTRANGITLALSVPSGGAISGTSALMMLDGWTWEAMTLKAPVGLHVRWPQMHARQSRFAPPPEEQRQTRDKQIELIRAAFTEARAYLKAKQAEGRSEVPYHDSDLRWDAMIPVLNGEIPVMLHANDIRQIQAAVDWATQEGVKLILVGGRDAWRVADLLKEKDIAVIIDGVHVTPARRREGYDTPFTNALKLYQEGVRFCISDGGGAAHQRNLPYHAATAAAFGLPREEALKAVTLYPAQILGVADFTTAFQGAGSRVPLPFLSLSASLSVLGIVLELVIGIWTLWLYGVISLCYGQGPKTAMIGGGASWFVIAAVTFSFASAAGAAMGSVVASLVFYLVAILVATTVGSLLYGVGTSVDQPVKAAAAQPVKASKPAPPKRDPEPKPAPAPRPKPAAPAPPPPVAKPPEPPASPAPAVEKTPEITQPVDPPSPPSAKPSPPTDISEQHQQLH